MHAETHPYFLEALDWIRQAKQQGWIKADIGALQRTLEPPAAAFQFDGATQRPLIVAFVGGTGVGKSTLLNRLARQELALTGVERPTSREVSLYLHQSLLIEHLPGDLPLSQTRHAHHQDERYRHILWIDMPDFDSTETHNREQVLRWLPHIDVLLYVVSPERYRDDQGWQILRSEGREHAWLFIMNQWDRGDPLQLRDFGKLLAQGGFADPVILCTDSSEQPDGNSAGDDFTLLEETLRTLADSHIGAQLESRALSIRMQETRELLMQIGRRMGCIEDIVRLKKIWRGIWQKQSEELLRALEWPIRDNAALLAQKLFTPALQGSGAGDIAPQRQDMLIWDDHAQMQLQDTLHTLTLEAENLRLPFQPLREGLIPLQTAAAQQILASATRGLRMAQARPGNKAQRFFLKSAMLCEVFLPLAAAAWIGRDIVLGYYLGSLNQRAFLGADFAIHALLLTGISWLLPFLLHRALTPSAERVAAHGLRKGIESGFGQIDQIVCRILDAYEANWKEQQACLDRLCSSSRIETSDPLPKNRLLERMLTTTNQSNRS
ncbi:GTPase [Candidatus Methylospira mobilis]|uniref:GTPase n=1 Tax=Candidatus Methylospira mobilis TaxID=1808979 RepID=UPI0028EC2D12|nr:GTPase [Candidatus Methylospira mobilis]WNV03637.1 GTPase [Candidatus Methylospira mobilis]